MTDGNIIFLTVFGFQFYILYPQKMSELAEISSTETQFYDNSKLFVVRHSERLDEVDIKEWEKIIQQNYPKNGSIDYVSELTSNGGRSKYCFGSDPPITENGKALSRAAAKTIIKILSELAEPGRISVKIFSSKLLRCIQV